jgi:hypothetical protein
MGRAEVGRAEEKGVLDIELIGAIGLFRFQCWSIPKTGCESDDGLLGKFIPEKSNDVDMPKEFRNCVIGESGLGG